MVRLNASVEVFQNREDLLLSAARGIGDVLALQGFEPRVSVGNEASAEFISVSEERAYNSARHQIDLTSHLLYLANNSDLASKNQADFVLTDKDMYAEGTNFVFGSTLSERQLSVQSVARFIRHTRDIGIQNTVTKHVARHEFAHLVGMNQSSDYINPDRHGGIYASHCANDCTLQQVMNVTEAINAAIRLADRQMAGFCPDCAKSLRQKAEVKSY